MSGDAARYGFGPDELNGQKKRLTDRRNLRTIPAVISSALSNKSALASRTPDRSLLLSISQAPTFEADGASRFSALSLALS